MFEHYDAIKQFRLALITLVALVCLGTIGYHLLEGWTLLDSLYMTVITLATVGYKEVHTLDYVGKYFTIVLILFGVSVVFWAGTSLIDLVVSEQIWHDFQRKRMQKTISKMVDHYIVCGFGRMGQQITKDLMREGVPFVVIESNPEQLPKLVTQGIPFIEGNLSDDEILTQAGIKRAIGLITVAPADEDNVFITLSARALNKNLYIVARSLQEENESKLKMAGANRVMSPYVMGGKRMAIAVLRPNVLDFLDLATHTNEHQMMIEELTIAEDSCLAGMTLAQSMLKTESGVTVIAIKKSDGTIIANPDSNEMINAGDILIVLGIPKQLQQSEARACQIKK